MRSKKFTNMKNVRACYQNEILKLNLSCSKCFNKATAFHGAKPYCKKCFGGNYREVIRA